MQLVRRAAFIGGVALGAAALTLPAAAAQAASAPAASARAAAAAVSSQDRTWMVAAHQSNLTEIQAGQAAQQKATSQKVKDLGAMFVTDHTTLDAQLKSAAGKLGVTLPSAPSAKQQATLKAVAAKSGAAFDSAWLASQLTGHAQALAATDKEIASGSDATVLKLAKASRPIIAKHYTELQAISGGAPGSVGAGTGGQAATSPLAGGIALTGAGLLLAAGAAGVLRRRRVEA